MNSLTPRFLAAALISAVSVGVIHAQSSATTVPAPVPAAGSRPDAEALSAINAGRNPPAYPVPYAPAKIEEITEVLNRVRGYLAEVTPPKMVDRKTQVEITDYSKLPGDAVPARGDFQLTSYEWGVTYSGMLLAAEVTGDAKYRDYVSERFDFIARTAPLFAEQVANLAPPPATGRLPDVWRTPFRQVNAPRSLDDSGAMAAAMIKAARSGLHARLMRQYIDRYLNWISKEQYRFPDGTLARHRPLDDALWLDDLYMSVPALAQMGALTGGWNYFDDAVKQIVQFSERMFVGEKGLYMHGWIGGMEPHPVFHWGRANGWAIMAMTELLEVLPADHPGREKVLTLYRAHVRGIAATQGGAGLWHQLLDRQDSYLETSASAIFVYCIARGINRGWLDAHAYTPMVSLGWNAVAKQVNAKGQVENVCVGTGMGFDPAFYYYRPVSVYAAHGYGPVLLAGAEMIALRKGKGAAALVSDGAVQNESAKSRH
ncbi:MAG: glycoside hydrolase family 88 protein [Nibricoccus sp.]